MATRCSVCSVCARYGIRSSFRCCFSQTQKKRLTLFSPYATIGFGVCTKHNAGTALQLKADANFGVGKVTLASIKVIYSHILLTRLYCQYRAEYSEK